jgi:hypothetical protein
VNLSQRERTLIKYGIIAGVVILVFSLYIAPSISKIKSAKRSYEYNRKQYAEFAPLTDRYTFLREKLDREKKSVGKADVTQDTFRSTFSIVLRDVGLSIDAFEIQFGGTREKGEFREFSFNIEGKDITYREFLLLVERIEKGEESLVIKEAKVKPTFESDKYLIVSLKISIISS